MPQSYAKHVFVENFSLISCIDSISNSNPVFLMLTSKPYTLDRVVRLIIGIAIACGILWLLNTLKGVLLPFCAACLLAYMLEPLVQFNRRILRQDGRAIAITATLLEVAIVVGLICFFILPMLFEEFHQGAILLRNYAQSENVTLMPDAVHDFLRRNIDFGYLASLMTRQDWMFLLEQLFSWLSSGLDVILGIFAWFIVVLYLVFIMIDYDRLATMPRQLIPPKYREITTKIGNDIKNSMNQYFRGQALVASCVGIMFCIGFLIIDLPMAIALGIFIGILNLVPYLQLISIAPTIMLCMMYSVSTGGSFWGMFWACMAVYAIEQIIQDGFLVPKIMGKSMGLNPAIILLSLSVWGTLLGFLGLIIALPLTTLLLAYYNEYVIHPKD